MHIQGRRHSSPSSFLDAIPDKNWTDFVILDSEMTIKCLAMMNEGLKFNICDLEYSRITNANLENLSQRIRGHTPKRCSIAAHIGSIALGLSMTRAGSWWKAISWIEGLVLDRGAEPYLRDEKLIPKPQYSLETDEVNKLKSIRWRPNADQSVLDRITLQLLWRTCMSSWRNFTNPWDSAPRASTSPRWLGYLQRFARSFGAYEDAFASDSKMQAGRQDHHTAECYNGGRDICSITTVPALSLFSW